MLWLAWRKFRFLRLPIEKRVRLEVEQDGRHITFILVSLYEAGYGVHVVGAPFVFRELMLLKKSVPMPFVVGGKDREVGISISDKFGFNHREHNRALWQARDGATEGWPEWRGSGVNRFKEHGEVRRLQLDYDYFSGLVERIEPRISRIYTDGQQGYAQGTCAGAEFSNSSTSELARASENILPTLSVGGPAGALFADHEDLGSAGGNQPADSAGFLDGQSQAGLQMDKQKDTTIRPAHDPTASRENSSSPATSYSPPAAAPEALRVPYFMHPSVYHRGLHKRRSPSTALATHHSAEGSSTSRQSPNTSYSPQRRRRFRIGFFGTHDREFYTQHHHFPGMNRFEILEVFLKKFGDRITPLRGVPRDWDSCEIAVSIDPRGGDRRGKSFLSQDHYFKALRECDFVLSPPGWCMPLSHNLIESMFCGAIPITNGSLFMAEPLSDRGTCLEFEDAEGLVAVIEHALAMDASQVELMRRAVLEYYDRFLEPKATVQELVGKESGRVFVNSEENSVRLVFPGMVFPWSVNAEARVR